MKKSLMHLSFASCVLMLSVSCMGQKAAGVISGSEVERIENVLASDSLQGRATGSAGIEKAAAFIAAEFKKAGLQPLQGTGFLQDFVVLRPKMKELTFKTDGADADAKNVFVFTSKTDLEVDEKSGY